MKIKRTMFALMAILVPLAACGDDDDEQLVLAGALDVPLTAQNVGAVVNSSFSFTDGGFIDASLAGVPITLTFTSSSTVRLEGGGTTVNGTVVYGSCTLTFPGFGSETYNPCDVRLTNGTSGDGTVSAFLRLGATLSQALNLDANIQSNGDGTCTVTLGGQVLSTNAPCTAPTGATGGGNITGPSMLGG